MLSTCESDHEEYCLKFQNNCVILERFSGVAVHERSGERIQSEPKCSNVMC
jgi:hypothetical protein